MPKVFKSCPKFNKSPNLVTLRPSHQKKVGKFIVLEQLLHPLHKTGIPFIFGKKIFLQNHFATLNNG